MNKTIKNKFLIPVCILILLFANYLQAANIYDANKEADPVAIYHYTKNICSAQMKIQAIDLLKINFESMINTYMLNFTNTTAHQIKKSVGYKVALNECYAFADGEHKKKLINNFENALFIADILGKVYAVALIVPACLRFLSSVFSKIFQIPSQIVTATLTKVGFTESGAVFLSKSAFTTAGLIMFFDIFKTTNMQKPNGEDYVNTVNLNIKNISKKISIDNEFYELWDCYENAFENDHKEECKHLLDELMEFESINQKHTH